MKLATILRSLTQVKKWVDIFKIVVVVVVVVAIIIIIIIIIIASITIIITITIVTRRIVAILYLA